MAASRPRLRQVCAYYFYKLLLLAHWRHTCAFPHQRATEDVADTSLSLPPSLSLSLYLSLSLSVHLSLSLSRALDTHTEVTYNVVLTCAVESLRDRFTRRGQDISHLNIDEVLINKP